MENRDPENNHAIYHYLETQLQVFKGHFLITQATMDEEAIHQMRVAIKRIRSIRKLKKHINFPSLLRDEQYVSIKALFAVSGQIRDLQVQRTLLKNYVSELKFEFGDFSSFLDLQESQLAVQLNQTIQTFYNNQFSEITQARGGIDLVEENTDIENESVEFLHRKIDKINKLILLIERDEFVHNLRKQVKQLFFILQFLKNHFPASVFSAYKLKALKDIGEHLGKWNDRDVILNRLHEFLEPRDDIYLEDNAEYQILIYCLEDEKKQMLKDIDLALYLEMINLKSLFQEDYKENQEMETIVEEANPIETVNAKIIE